MHTHTHAQIHYVECISTPSLDPPCFLFRRLSPFMRFLLHGKFLYKNWEDSKVMTKKISDFHVLHLTKSRLLPSMKCNHSIPKPNFFFYYSQPSVSILPLVLPVIIAWLIHFPCLTSNIFIYKLRIVVLISQWFTED